MPGTEDTTMNKMFPYPLPSWDWRLREGEGDSQIETEKQVKSQSDISVMREKAAEAMGEWTREVGRG